MTAKRLASWLQGFRLETPALSAVFWLSCAIYSLAFFLCRFPPMIDYPQHLAIGAILRRLADPAAPERLLYDVNLITYNGGFHLLVAALSFFVRPEIAGKILLALYPPLLGFAGLSLCRVANRPAWYALLLLPITYSYAAGWGFVNYVVSVPVALLAFTYWLRWQEGEARMRWRVWALSFVLAYTHVFATLCLCAAIGVAGIVRLVTRERTWPSRIQGVLRLPLAVMPAIVWCSAVFVRNRLSPHANWDSSDDGLDVPLWHKVERITVYAVGNFNDQSDQVLLGVVITVLILLWRLPKRRRASERTMVWLAIAFFALYGLIPRVMLGTWFMFERMPIWVLAFGIAAAPVLATKLDRGFRLLAAFLALAASVNAAWHFARIPDEADASAILDEIPPGQRVVAVTYANTGEPVVQREIWVHALAYYQARRPGLIGYSFTRFESMPVHYRVDARPPVLPGGIEWHAQLYDPQSDYGRFYDWVLVRAPEVGRDPRERVFGEEAGRVELWARRGRFWLYRVGDGGFEGSAKAPRRQGKRKSVGAKDATRGMTLAHPRPALSPLAARAPHSRTHAPAHTAVARAIREARRGSRTRCSRSQASADVDLHEDLTP